MTFFRPLPRGLSRFLTVSALVAWGLQMAVLARHAYSTSRVALAADLAQYGSAAQWRGVYYRGEKIGFVVAETRATEDGYDLLEDGRLQMSLLGATTAARLQTSAKVDRAFNLRSFSFSLDPGTGPTEVSGTVDGRRLHLRVRTASGDRVETRTLDEPPVLQMNLYRRLAAEGLVPGRRLIVHVLDPATLRNAPMELVVEGRELVVAAGKPVPAFKIVSRFAGITSTSWLTDLGESVREESPTGFMVVKETPQQAQAWAIPAKVRTDMLEAAAIVPKSKRRIDDPRAVRRLRVRVSGFGDLTSADLQGDGQTIEGDVIEITNAQTLVAGPLDPERHAYLAAEPFLESDDPEIRAEAERAIRGVKGARAQAERLLRHVNDLLEKRPTISLPSAREVLRTRVGDCNEHTALFVALARASGLPARIAVGLVQLNGAFYYHAWAEVYLEDEGLGLWLPADPTLNEFPADATHLRLARGGLDRQTAILGMIGRAEMEILDLEMTDSPILVGASTHDAQPLAIPLPTRDGSGPRCWSSPHRQTR